MKHEIYYDKEKTKPAEFEVDENGYAILEGDKVYYVFGESKVSARDKSVVWAFDYSQVEVFGESKVKAYSGSKVEVFVESKVKAYSGSKIKDLRNK